MRSPSQPAATEPTILNSPMVAMVQPPTVARQPAVDQIGRQVHGDELQLEAASEEAEHQQHIGAMDERFAQGLPQDCVSRARRGCPAASPAQATAAAPAACCPRRSPASVCQPNASISATRERRIEELAERARRGAETESE